jgi:hypothetical protein
MSSVVAKHALGWFPLYAARYGNSGQKHWMELEFWCLLPPAFVAKATSSFNKGALMNTSLILLFT